MKYIQLVNKDLLTRSANTFFRNNLLTKSGLLNVLPYGCYPINVRHPLLQAKFLNSETGEKKQLVRQFVCNRCEPIIPVNVWGRLPVKVCITSPSNLESNRGQSTNRPSDSDKQHASCTYVRLMSSANRVRPAEFSRSTAGFPPPQLFRRRTSTTLCRFSRAPSDRLWQLMSSDRDESFRGLRSKRRTGPERVKHRRGVNTTAFRCPRCPRRERVPRRRKYEAGGTRRDRDRSIFARDKRRAKQSRARARGVRHHRFTTASLLFPSTLDAFSFRCVKPVPHDSCTCIEYRDRVCSPSVLTWRFYRSYATSYTCRSINAIVRSFFDSCHVYRQLVRND